MFRKTFIPWTLSHVSKFPSSSTHLWQLPPSSWTLVPGWEVGVSDLESYNRGCAVQWDATSCFAYHDPVLINLFLSPLLYTRFGGLQHTEQQMFFLDITCKFFKQLHRTDIIIWETSWLWLSLLPLIHFPAFLWILRIYSSAYNNYNSYYFYCGGCSCFINLSLWLWVIY